MERRAFDILGIEVTKEKKEIKKAYAALVKKYHPEENPVEWTQIHEAYETAMKYAESDDTETVFTNKKQPESIEEEIHSDENYEDMFHQAQNEWDQEKAENGKILEKRMYELMKIKNKMAYTQWKDFFDHEFTAEADISSMQVLLEIVRAYPLQGDVIRLIMDIMSARAQKYHSSENSDKALLASEIVKFAQAQIPQQSNINVNSLEKQPAKKRRIFPAIILIGVILLVAVGSIVTIISGSRKRDAMKQAAAYLNEKYGDTGYTADDLEADEVYLYSEFEDKMTAYWISEKDTYSRVIYAVSKKGKSDFICFDNLQEREIKQALQNKINDATGHTEGKLFWNSSAGGGGAIEDGYFQTKFDGDIDGFMEKESKARASSPEAKAIRLYGSATAKNGNCDYYVPDSVVETIEQRLSMEEVPEDEELQKTLEEFADEYDIQLRGITVPKIYFEEKIKKAAWDSRQLNAEEAIHSDTWMKPPVSFLMMTGWYVNVPSEDKNLLNIENGRYTVNPILVGEGIYGTQRQINRGEGMYSSTELGNRFIQTEIPESVKLTDSQKEKAVSIHFTGAKELKMDLNLAIDKDVYHIADSGYRVYLTEIGEGGEETEELDVFAYDDESVEIQYGDAMDGEGYLFLEYPAFWEWEKAHVITIVNP